MVRLDLLNKDVTPYEVAVDISEGFARNVISAKFNDTVVETTTPLTTDGSLTLYTFRDDAGKKGVLAFLGSHFGSGFGGIIPRREAVGRSSD